MRALLVTVLLIVNVVIFSYHTERTLKVSFLDVGQGDAIFIEGPTGVQFLIDGGPSRSVLSGVRDSMSFFDRTIDALLLTHPDQDHVGGLSFVLNRYNIAHVIESGNISHSPAYSALARAATEESARHIEARAGQRFLLGGGAYADVLFPDRDVRSVESNTASIILRIVYGDTAFLVTGDAPSSVEKYLVSVYGNSLKSDVLKAGHHGSKTSSAPEFVETVHPSHVIFSRGCENRYGHPAREVVERFQKLSIPTLDTCEEGTITFNSDGKTLRVER